MSVIFGWLGEIPIAIIGNILASKNKLVACLLSHVGFLDYRLVCSILFRAVRCGANHQIVILESTPNSLHYNTNS